MLIPIYRLQQCALAMPKKDPRKILTGILLKRVAGQVTMVATNGKVLLKHEFTRPDVWPDWMKNLEPAGTEPDTEVVLAGDTVTEVLKQCKNSEFVFLTEPEKDISVGENVDGQEVMVPNWNKAEIKYAPDPRNGKRRLYTMPAETEDGKYPPYELTLQAMEERLTDPARRPVSIILGQAVLPFLLDLAKQWGETADRETTNNLVTLLCYPEEHRTEHYESIAVVPRDPEKNGRGLIMPVRTNIGGSGLQNCYEPMAHYYPQVHARFADPVKNPAVPFKPNYTDPEVAETYQAVVRDNGMNDPIEMVEDDGPLAETGGTPGAIPL